jgi:regulator of protease activity HflC (stomatin/prohibitin superfamily)
MQNGFPLIWMLVLVVIIVMSCAKTVPQGQV